MQRAEARDDGTDGASASAADRCACGALSVCEEYRAAFGVALCRHCKAADELLPKGRAKQLYLLTDADIAHLGRCARQAAPD